MRMRDHGVCCYWWFWLILACVDAYLTPCIKQYLSNFEAGFDDRLSKVNVLFMQSDGGLTPMHRWGLEVSLWFQIKRCRCRKSSEQKSQEQGLKHAGPMRPAMLFGTFQIINIYII